MQLGPEYSPSTGAVSYQGKELANYTDDELSEHRGQNIGFLFQNVQLAEALTVEQNIILAKKYSSDRKIVPAEIKLAMDELGIWDKRNLLPHQLSGGQRRRVMLATTWIRNPSLILADEPTNDLDQYWAQKVFSLFSEWVRAKKAVIFVTHHDHWSNYANKKFQLQNGFLERM